MMTAEMTSHHFQHRWDDDDLWYPTHPHTLVSTPHALLYLLEPICISYADPSLSLSLFPFLSFNGYTCFTHKPISITLNFPYTLSLFHMWLPFKTHMVSSPHPLCMQTFSFHSTFLRCCLFSCIPSSSCDLLCLRIHPCLKKAFSHPLSFCFPLSIICLLS